MRKTLQILCSIFLALNLFLISCTKKDKPKIEERYKLNLTKKEKMEDYEFFWDFIYNGFPFIEVTKRNGADLEKIKKEQEVLIYDLKTKQEYLYFYKDLCLSIINLKPTGHLSALTYTDYNPYYACHYNYDDENTEKLVQNFYVDEGIDNAPTNRIKKTDLSTKIADTKFHRYLFADTKIIKTDEILYLRIDSFLNKNKTDDKLYFKNLDDFFSNTGHYKHLIIDVSLNRGGYSKYWKYIVGVHLRNEITYCTYGLYNENKYTKKFLDKAWKNYLIEKNTH